MTNASRDLGRLHHACLAEGAPDAVCKQIVSVLRDEFGYGVEGNPDAFVQTFDTLRIEDVHMVRTLVSQLPVAGKHRVFVIGAWAISGPAQNALLKTLEEPSAHARLFLAVPSRDMLLPAVLSRVEMFEVSDIVHAERDEERVDPHTFITSSVAQRYDLMSSILKHKDARALRAFLVDVEQEYVRTNDASRYKAYDVIWKAVSYTDGGSGNVKSVVDYVVCGLPRV